MVHRACSFGRRIGLPRGKFICRECDKTHENNGVDLRLAIRVTCPFCGRTCDPEGGLQPECSAKYYESQGKVRPE